MKKFEQLKRLYTTMQEEYAVNSTQKMYVSGITSDFDRLFELCWKTLREYLRRDEGMLEASTGSPREIIKLSFREHLLHDEEFWLHLLADRNDDAHHYNESAARAYAARIHRDYLAKIGALIEELKVIIPEEHNALIDMPDDFVQTAVALDMYYDDFLALVKEENGFSSDVEVFINWEKIKNKYTSTPHNDVSAVNYMQSY